MTHYDTVLTPTCTVAISGPHAIVARDGDLSAPAHLAAADIPALRAALARWEAALVPREGEVVIRSVSLGTSTP
jgi:hypothetical protein